MIDEDGFRANVGIILCNEYNKLFWGHRIGHLDSWQFPQGGINESETPVEAMHRELKEEIGLNPNDVEILGHTMGWIKYRLPQKLIRKNNTKNCIGQKQIWFMLPDIPRWMIIFRVHSLRIVSIIRYLARLVIEIILWLIKWALNISEIGYRNRG
jgi:8-oxo-dGTP pyrophosphatase MutT (NUDIX family)